MNYYAAILEMVDADKSKQWRPEHLEYLKGLLDEGKVFACGPFVDGSGGMVIYQAETEEAARRLAEQDPYIVQGARRLVLREWKMTQTL